MTFFETIQIHTVAIILTVLWLAYICAFFYYKGKIKFPKWIIIVGAVILAFAWFINHETYLQQKEWAEIDEGLKKYFVEKTKDLSYVSADSIHKEYSNPLTGKMIAVILDDEKNETILDYRLNDELKKNDKYTTYPDSLDYVIVILPYWHTDFYQGNNTSLTEMANVFVLDYKADTIVKTRNFNENKNPFAVRREEHSSGSSEMHHLTGEELYKGIIYNQEQEQE